MISNFRLEYFSYFSFNFWIAWHWSDCDEERLTFVIQTLTKLTPCISEHARSGSCMAGLVAATDHRVKYINRSVIIFADHRGRLRRPRREINIHFHTQMRAAVHTMTRAQRVRHADSSHRWSITPYYYLNEIYWSARCGTCDPAKIILFDWSDRFWTNLTLQWRPLTAMI